VIFEKEIDFSEYKEYVFQLAYLMDRNIVDAVKKAPSFTERTEIITSHYEKIIKQNSGRLKKVSIVTSILQQCYENNNFDVSVKDIAAEHEISPRTLQRYFEATASIKCKPALQLVRIRKAIYHFIDDPEHLIFLITVIMIQVIFTPMQSSFFIIIKALILPLRLKHCCN
jgi:AraC-like DNA-binding protein